jgi:3-oxoacyl-[acyl-carrier-protein] synthase II
VSRRRVAVTGLGIVCPVGNTVEEAWQNLVAGKSGIGAITRFDAAPFACRIAGEVKGFDVSAYLPAKEARHMDLFIHYGLAAAIQAWKDCGLQVTERNAERIGVNIGSGIGGLPRIEETHTELRQRGPRRISPFFVPASIINMISGHVSILYGMKGPNLAVVTACTTGLHAVGQAARLIEYGDADVMLAGGAEATISPWGSAASRRRARCPRATTTRRPRAGPGTATATASCWERARACSCSRSSSRRARAARASIARSRLRHERGCVPHDGAGRERAPPLHAGGARQRAHLPGAGAVPERPRHLHPLGDKNETEAIKLAFGEHAKALVVNSTKSMTGHLLGGAGGIESVFTALAVHKQISPPTINILNQDPECDLDYCANTARDLKIQYALKNNFGFGGTNGTLVFGRV